jgi:hypothetical protein
VATFLHVERFIAGRKPPYIAKVYQPSPAEAARGGTAGRVELWYPRANP